MNDCSNCPIPDTHQKLKEAIYFLGRCAEHYHEPEKFQFNLNAFIQALRNITFMLQSEPSKPDIFSAWYANKQTEMSKSDLLRRFVKARNVVVKQSSLKAQSTARSGVFRGRHLKLGMNHSVPLFAPSEWVLERLKANVGFFLDEGRSQPWAQFGIYRIWAVEELGKSEVLGLCVQAINYLGAIVEDAHRVFGTNVESSVVELDMLRTQTLLETDADPSLVERWGWNDAV